MEEGGEFGDDFEVFDVEWFGDWWGGCGFGVDG